MKKDLVYMKNFAILSAKILLVAVSITMVLQLIVLSVQKSQYQKQLENLKTWNQLVENNYKPFEKNGCLVTYNKYSDDFEITCE